VHPAIIVRSSRTAVIRLGIDISGRNVISVACCVDAAGILVE
jgi:hypothetical protein